MRTTTTKTLIIILISLLTKDILAQDYSSLGKSINYTDNYRKAKRITNIDKALLAPDKVLYLELIIDKDGINYQKFVDNQSHFKNLKKLIIDNRWYQIDLLNSLDISSHTDLEYLQVYNLPNLNFDKLVNLTNLKYLDLDACGLKTLPSSIIKLNKLELLNLSLNHLSSLPDNISEMKSLKELDLTNNCFQEIPKQIETLTELLYLDINNAEIAGSFLNGNLFCKNTLTIYPSILSNCKKIKKVHLYKVSVDDDMKQKLKADYKTIKFIF